MKADVVLTITSEDQCGHIVVQTISHTSTFISGKKKLAEEYISLGRTG